MMCDFDWHAFFLGVMVAWSPSLVVLALILRKVKEGNKP